MENDLVTALPDIEPLKSEMACFCTNCGYFFDSEECGLDSALCEDCELVALIKEREGDPTIRISLDEL